MEWLVILGTGAVLLDVGILVSMPLENSYLSAWIESHKEYRNQKRKAKRERNKERKSTKKILDVLFSDKNIDPKEIINDFRKNNIDIPLKINKIENPLKKSKKLKKFITNYPKKFPMRENPEKEYGRWSVRSKYSYEESEQLSKMFKILLSKVSLDENIERLTQTGIWENAPEEFKKELLVNSDLDDNAQEMLFNDYRTRGRLIYNPNLTERIIDSYISSKSVYELPVLLQKPNITSEQKKKIIEYFDNKGYSELSYYPGWIETIKRTRRELFPELDETVNEIPYIGALRVDPR